MKIYWLSRNNAPDPAGHRLVTLGVGVRVMIHYLRNTNLAHCCLAAGWQQLSEVSGTEKSYLVLILGIL